MDELKAFKEGVWYLGNAGWVFGICDRTLASTMDGMITSPDLIQLSTAGALFVAWLFLKP